MDPLSTKMSIAEALKPKHGSKHLSMIVNAEGKVVQAETRDDEEQAVKHQEIIDLLYAAGYFRARIKGLSAFDKILGGMTWCIDSCDVDIDVDLLFQENLTIGQRIALTEKIVAVLPKIKCPHRIEPHQIQGLDFIHIYPVIQWLVKHSIEKRKETETYYRAYAVSQFDKMHPSTKAEEAVDRRNKINFNIKTIQEKFRPQRNYRRVGAPPKSLQAQVESTLFEFGHFPSITVSNESKDGGSFETQKVDEVRSRQLLSAMTSMPEQESRLAAGVVGSIVSLQAAEISKAVEHYTELQAQTQLSEASQMQRLKEKVTTLEEEKQTLKRKVEEETKKMDQLKDVEHGTSPIHTFSEEEQGILKKLQNLIITHEALKQQDQDFRDQCKEELEHLQQLIKEAEESEGTEGDGEQSSRVVEELSVSLANTRLALGRKTRAVASLQRQLDQVPSRAELAQYQRRFVELYSQVAARHRETKQFFTLYNTLNDTHAYLNKELSLLTSISDNYHEAMATPSGKDQYVQQLEKILGGVKVNKDKVKKRLTDERQQRDQLTGMKLELVEAGRQCVAAYKQAGIEANHNEALLSQLRSLPQAQG